jgi:hypothetical protein
LLLEVIDDGRRGDGVARSNRDRSISEPDFFE